MRLHHIYICFLAIPLFLSGCGGKRAESASVNSQPGYPIVINHVFGQTIISAPSQRVIALAWANSDTPLALGVAPVGLSQTNYGSPTPSGIQPWTAAAYAGLGVEPLVFKDAGGWDYEAISDLSPDLILAALSGLSRDEYETLSSIAPVIAQPDRPWQTLWREHTRMNAEALGQAEAGEELVRQTEALIAEKTAAYPHIAGKRVAFLAVRPDDLSSFSVYAPTSSRAAYLMDLGLAFPESLREFIAESESFYTRISREYADRLSDVEIIVLYGTDSVLHAMQADPLLNQIPAVRTGALVLIAPGSELAGATTTPTVLSIPESIDSLLALVSEAALKVSP